MDITTQPNVRRLGEMLTSADGQKRFIEWLGDDMTQLMLSAGRDLCRPSRPDPSTSSDFKLGEAIGANSILDFMMSPVVAKTLVAPPKVPERSYGAVAGVDELVR